MNYTELVQQIQDQVEYAETTFVAAIPDFVRRAEQRIHRMVQISNLKRVSQSVLTASNPFITMPIDYLSTYSFAVTTTAGAMSYLLSKEYEFLRTAYPNNSVEGLPKYYCLIDDDTMQLAPLPDIQYAVEMYYFYLPDSIVVDTNTWLGDNAGNALFWGSVVEGYKFMKGDADIMNTYENSFAEAIAELKILTEGRNRKGSYRQPDTKVKV